MPEMNRIDHYKMLTGCSGISFTGSLKAIIARHLMSAIAVLLVANIAILLRVPIFIAFLRRAKAGVPSFVRLLASI